MRECFSKETANKTEATSLQSETAPFILLTRYTPVVKTARPKLGENVFNCQSGGPAQSVVRPPVPHLLSPSQVYLLKLNFSSLPAAPSPLICSSVYRKYSEYLSGESRWFSSCHLCQWDGDQPQLRAPHSGRGCQPHSGQMQHFLTWRAQCKPH